MGEDGEGGTLLMARGEKTNRRRSRSRERRDGSGGGALSWKQKLIFVQQTLKSINKDGVAVRLIDNVSSHLHETVAEMIKLDTSDSMKWEELVDLFVDSRDFYVDKADTLSFFTGDMSPFHLFDAIASGLEFDEEKTKQLGASDDREAWLASILSNVGKRIEDLNAKRGYFDRVISKGSGVLFVKIAGILQGMHGYGGDAVVAINSSYDWRTALEKVLDKVNNMQRPENMFVGAIYEKIKVQLNTTIKKLEKISKADLEKGGMWEFVYERLHERMVSFEMLSGFPYVGDLFDALHAGLKIIGTRSEWVKVGGDREHAMEVVFKSIGSKLKNLDSKYYDQFLPRGGGKIMDEIAEILSNVGK